MEGIERTNIVILRNLVQNHYSCKEFGHLVRHCRNQGIVK